MSVSSPDLGEGRSTGPRRVPLVKQFAQRLGSFAISRRTRRSATSPSPGQNDARKLSQPPGGFGQSLGKERKLVSDETVIIGKPIEPANGAGMVAGQERGREQQATSHEGRQAVEHATIHVARRESLSRYKPAGTKDEIKAQLGEGVPSIWRPTSISPRSAGEEHDTEVDALTWIDPGSNTIMHGKLILPSSVCARQRPEPADRRGRPTFSLWSDGASCSGSRVSDQAIEQASPGRSEQLSPSMLSPQPARRGSAHLAESDLTRSSSMSNETPGDTVVWDASSVNLDDLFFRPPQ
ncbi:hypothetical protein [Sporisorium scitamineum]|nr:hypothetical protein [Sporisorium scitamineum]